MLSYIQYTLQTEDKKTKPNQSVQDAVKAAARVARQQRLEREQQVGRARSKSWGGRPDARAQRRQTRRDLQND
jgi:hypothetical protein